VGSPPALEQYTGTHAYRCINPVVEREVAAK
jgi:hypothetical protein